MDKIRILQVIQVEKHGKRSGARKWLFCSLEGTCLMLYLNVLRRYLVRKPPEGQGTTLLPVLFRAVAVKLLRSMVGKSRFLSLCSCDVLGSLKLSGPPMLRLCENAAVPGQVK